ncbi:MAG: SusF/SusE family outer membrane protein [Lachnospiraceae bacterium]|nr:SusF/SusE family outer membrane protein [Lachnospiraceae bacterium]
MKKKLLAVVLSAAMALTLIAGCGDKKTSTSASGSTKTSASASVDQGEKLEYDITVWCPEKEKPLREEQIKAFNDTNPDGIKFNATVEAVSEADAATQMITDVEAGADLFNFAQDQISRLIIAGALIKLDDEAAKFVKENNDESSVAAVTSGDALYGYPLTSDNGYFLFYDKSVVSEEQAKTVQGVIDACKAAGRVFAAPLKNGWYVAGWFFGTGCDSTWEADDAGNYVGLNDTFNSDKGLIAAKGIYQITSSGVWVDSDQMAAFDAAIPAGALVCGPWANGEAKQILGDNLGAAKLPTYVVDGKTYQIGSYAGSKILGVKPQTDATKAVCLSLLAEYLTGKDCQLQRLENEELMWGPSNLEAQKSDTVTQIPGLVALAAQAPFAKPQGTVSGKWWDIGNALGTAISESNGTDAELKDILQNYYDQCYATINMTSDEKEAWGVVGSFLDSEWSKDYPMNRVPETGDVTYYSEALALKAGDELKVRQGGGWDVNFGGDGQLNGANLAVEEDGVYYVKLVLNADVTEATLTLEKTSYFEWSVIGALLGSNWDADFEMSVQADGTTFVLEGAELKAGNELKVRKSHSWDLNYGADGAANGANIVVAEDGTYTITFDSTTGMVTLTK